MHLIAEVFWKLIALVVVCLFTISLPFTLVALWIWHPHLSVRTNDAMYFFKLCAVVFAGCAAAFWWIVIKMVVYMVTKERVWIGGWSTVLVFFGTYYMEYLLFSHGVIR